VSHSPHSTASALKSWAKKHVRIVHFTLMVNSPNLAPHSHQLHIHQCRCPVVIHGEALEGLRKYTHLISRSQKFGHIHIRPYCDFEVLIGISHRTHLGVIVVMSTMLLCYRPGPPPLPRFEADYFQEIITRRLFPRRLFAGDCSKKTIPRRLYHRNYSKDCSKGTIRGIPHHHHPLPNNTPTPHRNLEAKRIAYHV